MKTSLVVLAAGIGSRYGNGIKQLEHVGPSGEIIMDYSIHDGLEAGFDKIVFIIRKDLEEEFKKTIGERMARKTEVAYAFQEVDELPEGMNPPAGRTKPWGTVQAMLCAKEVINEPCLVINADDYYGKGAFAMAHDYLVSTPAKTEDGKQNIGMVSFILKNTLSENGGVTRGICVTDDEGRLTGIDETKNIIKSPDGAFAMTDDGLMEVNEEAQVSMNLWAFHPEILDLLETRFKAFLSGGAIDSQTKEYVLPTAIDEMIKDDQVRITIAKSEDKWFGVTYQDDKAAVKEAIAKLVEEGSYDSPLD